MTTPIEFWFDFSSPYAYFASAEIEARLKPFGRPVLWRPFLLGVVFRQTGMVPVFQAPLRGGYAAHDCRRIAALLGIPFRLRPDFPFPSQNVARAFYWFEACEPAPAKDFARAAFATYFGEAVDLRERETVLGLARRFTDHADALARWLDGDEARRVLRERTAEALARGIFGAPFFLVDDEPFWGWDRLPMVEAWLRRPQEAAAIGAASAAADASR